MTEEIGNLVVRVGLDGANFDSGLQNINSQMRLAQSELRAAGGSMRNFGQTTDQLRVRAASLGTQLGLQGARVQQLRDHYARLVTEQGAESDAALRAGARVNNAIGIYRNLEHQLNTTTSAISRQTSRLRIAQERLTTFGSRLTGIGDKMTGVGRTMTLGLTTPIVGGLGYAVKASIDFSQQLTNMRALLDDGTVSAEALTKQVGSLGQKSREWAAQYGVSTASVNDGITELIKKGYTYNQVIGAMPSILDAARASGDDFNTVMHVSTSVLEQFGLKASSTSETLKNTQHVTDILTYAANKTAAGFSDMGTAMEYVGPVAHANSIPLNDMAAAIGLLSNRGIEGDKAGTALRGMISSLIKPSKNARKAIEKMGLEIVGTNGKLKPMADILQQIKDKTKSWDEAARNAAETQIFGREPLAAVNALVDQGGDALAKLSKETDTATGYTKKLSDQMGNSSQNKVKSLVVSLDVLAQELGDQLIPAILPVVKETTNLAKEFGDLSPHTKKMIVDMALVAAAAGPVALTLGSITKVTGLLSKGIGGAIGLFAKLAGGLAATGEAAVVAEGGLVAVEGGAVAAGGAMAILTGPIGLAILALGGLAAGIYALTRSHEKLTSVSTKTADSMIKQHDANAKLIDSFDALRIKSQLTNDEFGRYLDIQAQIKNASDPKVLDTLQKEMDGLQKKSGLSNDQLQKMVGLNKDITDNMPQSTKQITEQGNRIADTTDKLKGYNAEIEKASIRELEEKRLEALKKQKEIADELAKKQKAYNLNLEIESSIREKLQNWNQQAVDSRKEELKTLIAQNAGNKGLVATYQIELDQLNLGKEGLQEQLLKMMAKNDEAKKGIDHLKDAQNQLDAVNQKLAEQLLVHGGIDQSVADQAIKQGKVNELIDTTVAKLEAQKQKIIDQTPASQRNTQEFQNAIDKIDTQIAKLQDAKGEINDMTAAAVDYNATLASPIEKEITIRQTYVDIIGNGNGGHAVPNGYATGTDNYPGGWGIVGEKGPELVRLPKGSQIFTNSISNAMMKKLADIPKLATGGSIVKSGLALVGERGRELYRAPSASAVPLQAKNTGGGPTYNIMPGAITIDMSKLKDIRDVIALLNRVVPTARQYGMEV